MNATTNLQSVLTDPGNLSLLERKFFRNYHNIRLSGTDSISFEKDDNGCVTSVLFPTRWSASKIDIGSTLHEMGHFVTMPEERLVQDGFGMSGTVPDFIGCPRRSIYTRSYSDTVEADAFAWESILLKDLFDYDLDIETHVQSLKYASDFHLYPGAKEEDKLAHVASLTRQTIVRFREQFSFYDLWHSKVTRLPEIMDTHNKKLQLLSQPPNSSQKLPPLSIYGAEWDVSLEFREHDNLSIHSVCISHDFRGSAIKHFKSPESAHRWLEKIVSAYGIEAPNTNSLSM